MRLTFALDGRFIWVFRIFILLLCWRTERWCRSLAPHIKCKWIWNFTRIWYVSLGSFPYMLLVWLFCCAIVDQFPFKQSDFHAYLSLCVWVVHIFLTSVPTYACENAHCGALISQIFPYLIWTLVKFKEIDINVSKLEKVLACLCAMHSSRRSSALFSKIQIEFIVIT